MLSYATENCTILIIYYLFFPLLYLKALPKSPKFPYLSLSLIAKSSPYICSPTKTQEDRKSRGKTPNFYEKTPKYTAEKNLYSRQGLAHVKVSALRLYAAQLRESEKPVWFTARHFISCLHHTFKQGTKNFEPLLHSKACDSIQFKLSGSFAYMVHLHSS